MRQTIEFFQVSENASSHETPKTLAPSPSKPVVKPAPQKVAQTPPPVIETTESLEDSDDWDEF